MTGPTKVAALKKLEKFTTKIGYPDKWKDYSGLDIDPNDLIGNIMRSSAFEHEREINKLGKPVDRTEWFMTPQTVNAYYNPSMNEIVFPAAILQPPFFNMKADDAVNYGAIGMVIGHEIGHGFDDQGRKSDGDGNLVDWWTEEDAKAYEERTAKLVAQYETFEPEPGFFVNGQLTLGENIGDLGGLTLAYRAYQKSLDSKPALAIDGLSGEQRFFLSLAQIWRI
jgi:endothelin-converting enzyme